MRHFPHHTVNIRDILDKELIDKSIVEGNLEVVRTDAFWIISILDNQPIGILTSVVETYENDGVLLVRFSEENDIQSGFFIRSEKWTFLSKGREFM